MLRQKARNQTGIPQETEICIRKIKKKKTRLPEGEQVKEDQVIFIKLTRLKADSKIKGCKEACGIAGRTLFKIRLIKFWFEDYKTSTVL